MDIEMIAIVSGVVFGAGIIVAKYAIGRVIAVRAEKHRRAGR